MTIVFQCDCGKGYRVKPELAGRRVKCAACGRVLEVPSPAPQLEDLKSLADPFTSLPALQSAPLAAAPTIANPLSSPLNSPALGNASNGGDVSRWSAGVPLWAWIAAGGGGVGALVVVAIIVAVSMGGNAPRQAASSAPTAGSTPPVRQISAASRTVTASPPSPPKLPEEQSKGQPREATGQVDSQTFQSAQGGYSVNFPGQPKHREDQRATPKGNLKVYTDYVVSPGSGVFGVAYANNLEGDRDIERAARNAAAGMANGAGGKIIETRNVRFKGAASKLYVIEAAVKGTTLQIHVVYFLTRDRLYTVSWTGSKGTASDAEIAKFMGSFRSESN